MEFESPDVEKDFPGLYASEGGKKSNESDFSDDSQHHTKKDHAKTKEKKESKKDRGYATLEGESSQDEADGGSSMRSPTKSKKSKSFKFSTKKEKREKSREKDAGREIEVVKETKEKKKDETKEKKKEKESIHPVAKLKSIKDKKLKSKHSEESIDLTDEPPVFGVSLDIAFLRYGCHDGIKLPLIVRNCLDFIEECGLTVDGIYKTSGNKSKAQQLRKLYNAKQPVSFIDCDPTTVAGLLKLFLRELPDPIVPINLTGEFEESAGKRGEGMDKLVNQLPPENKEILGWLVLHCKHLVANEKLNKCGGLQGVCTTFAPLLRITPKVLSALICYSASLFPSVTLSRYIPPLSGPSPALPNTIDGCKEELKKLESLLAQVHREMNEGLAGKRREEQLWDAQRIVTQLKRKLRALQKPLEPRVSDDDMRMDFSLKHEEPPSVVPTTTTTTTVSTITTTAIIESAPAEVPNAEIIEENINVPEKDECIKDSQVVPVDDSTNQKDNDDDSIVPDTDTATTELIEKETFEQTTNTIDFIELEEILFNEQLEELAKHLSERIIEEKAHISIIKQEIARAIEDGKISTSDKNEANTQYITELLEHNHALLLQRDSLMQQIIDERESIARTKAQIILKQRLRSLKI